MRNAYIFDDVTIGPNCVLESCIIGAGVQIGEGSRVARGSLIADGVELGPGTVLRSFDRVSKRKQRSNPSTIGELIEDEGDEGDDDSEFEEAEQSTHFRTLTNPLLIADWAILTWQAKPSFRKVWALARTPSCGPGVHRRVTRMWTRTRWRASTTDD